MEMNSFEKNFEELSKFVKKTNRLPQSNNAESKLKNFIDQYKSDSKVVKLVEQYKARR